MDKLSPNLRGIGWMMLASISYPTMSALVKWMALEGYHSFQITFFRCVFGLIAILPFIVGNAREALNTTRRRMHLASALTVLGAIFFSVYSFIALPLAEAVALTFTKPLWMTILAVILFGEIVGWRRWSAVSVGFLGVLIITRPGIEEISFGAVAALIAALGYALQALIGKSLSTTEAPSTIVFYSVAGTAVLSLIPAIPVWQPVSWQVFGVGLAIGILGTAAQLFTIRALKVGEASAVAPFDYFRLLYATIWGYLLFAELPGPFTWLGASVIVFATLYIAQRERAAGRG